MKTASSTGGGLLPNGNTWGQGLANANGNNEILLGGGNVYFMNVASIEGENLPADDVIETSANNVGWCESGFKINYKPKQTKVYNQFDQLVKTFITREEITAKTGILTWNLSNIALMSNATLVPATNANMENTVVFTGSGELTTMLLRFVHTKGNGKKIRFTMVGQGGSGFGIDFGDKATSLNAEITGIQYFNNFLASFREELSQEEFNALYPTSSSSSQQTAN